MRDVIDFLERMGQDAALRHASEAVLEQAMREAQMSSRARAALISGNRAAIQAVAGAESNVCCAVFAPEPEGEEKARPNAVIGVDDNVCCLIHAPLPEGNEEAQESALGVDDNVCCMIFAPTPGGEEQESVEGERQKAA